MFEFLDFANLWIPGNRREVAGLLFALSLLASVVFLGVLMHEVSASSEPIVRAYLATPAWLRWSIIIAPAICLGAIALYWADVAAERRMRQKIGTWPRRHGQDGT